MQKAQMIIANPGDVVDTKVNLSWHTSYLDSYCLYTSTTWEEAKKIYPTYHKCDCFKGVFSITENREDIYEDIETFQCRAELVELTPNTKYMYKIITDCASEIHYFKTASKHFKFSWVADFHAYLPIKSRLKGAFELTKSLSTDVDFILCGGDAISWGGSYSFWLDMYRHDLIKDYLWVNVLGNHDYMSRANQKNTDQYFRYVNNFPLNGYKPYLGVCYYFYYGDALFIVINNEAMGFEQTNEEVKLCQNWVEEVLKNNTAKWIIFVQHYEWFQGITGNPRKFGYLRWHELFDKYHVDLAIGNNNHIYVRSNPIYNDQVGFGTTYIQAPSSDNERGQELGELNDEKGFIAKRFSEGAKTIGVLKVTVDDNITVRLYDRFQTVIDQVIIKKEIGK